MSLNVFALSKTELKKRQEFKCIHRHNGIQHPECYNKDKGIEEKIGFLDIETSNLKATYGIVFSYCIKKLNGEIIKRSVTSEELKNGTYDKNLMKQFCIDARKFTKLVGYYSSRFDMPFLRSRCVYYKLDFPLYKEINHTDLYMIIKHKFNFHSRRLGTVCEFFGIKAKFHPMTSSVWFRAMQGKQDALNYIMVHNIEDVESTENLWLRINQYARDTKSSI